METLQQHLLEQVNSQRPRAPHDRKLAELIIGNIDDAGFLQTDPGGNRAKHRHGRSPISSACSISCRLFIPSASARAICASACSSSSSASARSRASNTASSIAIIDDLGKRRFPEIARRLGTTAEQVQRAANFIATLDPKPGQIFTPDPNNYVLPDVTVEKIGGDWQISLNGEQIPHLRISNTYKDLMSQDKGGADVKDYIRDKIRSGKFLIKSIHQRQQTISNIAHEIVARQKDFLESGPSALKPMTMVQIADAVGVHETTVSRAISGKYMSTPQGVFDMKYFFTPGYQTAGGESMSNTSVKGAIAELVKAEDTKNPLSDKEIVEILEKRGIPIARRTVAKYRNELNILPSNMRKRLLARLLTNTPAPFAASSGSGGHCRHQACSSCGIFFSAKALAERDVVRVKRIFLADDEGEAHAANLPQALAVREIGHEMARHDGAQRVVVEAVEERMKIARVQREIVASAEGDARARNAPDAAARCVTA